MGMQIEEQVPTGRLSSLRTATITPPRPVRIADFRLLLSVAVSAHVARQGWGQTQSMLSWWPGSKEARILPDESS